MVPARRWRAFLTARNSSHGKVKIVETDGSSSGQKKYDLVVPLHGSIWSLKWKKSSLLLATQYLGGRESWIGSWHQEQRKKLG